MAKKKKQSKKKSARKPVQIKTDSSKTELVLTVFSVLGLLGLLLSVFL